MARSPFIRSDVFPYHISARCHNKDWYSLPLDEVWRVYEDWLYFCKFAYNMKIHSFVLMSNHFHLLASFPDNNISESMQYFMKQTSNSINDLSKRINQVYGSRYHRTLIEKYHHYMNAYKYVYRNPVEAGICRRAEDYCFSTLHGLSGSSKLHIPVSEDTVLFNDTYDHSILDWINTEPLHVHREQMSAALKRKIFKLSKYSSSKNYSALESSLY